MFSIIATIVTSLLALETADYMLIGVCVCGVIGGITGFVAYRAGKRKSGGKDAKAPAKEASAPAAAAETETAASDNVVMSRNVVYSAGADGQIKTGKYVLQSADDSTDKFNLRFNGLVKEYSNGDVVTLADGDTLSPVSGSVVIRKAE